jgi:hypothetical protein
MPFGFFRQTLTPLALAAAPLAQSAELTGTGACFPAPVYANWVEAYQLIDLRARGSQAARVSDYTAYMYLGALVETGRAESIFIKPQKRETEDYIPGRFG